MLLMAYDMRDLFTSCVTAYLKASGNETMKLKQATAPFLAPPFLLLRRPPLPFPKLQWWVFRR